MIKENQRELVMRFFKGFLKVCNYLMALSGCQDAMKGNEVYPTADNLIEIDPDQLSIMEASNSDNGILIVVGESPSHKCEILIPGANLGQKIAVTSLMNEEGIEATCLWGSEKYIQSREHHTVTTARVADRIIIDIQLYNPSAGKYLAITAFLSPSKS
ncbi:hypothetical protein ACJJIF_09670 [Microbulbifer sp. SSSA002]|uniref:hypothetical protein n=1 Tax=Microbulbifer sp. SSSA002 TaxID=3243376 RepID=UPI00403A38C4